MRRQRCYLHLFRYRLRYFLRQRQERRPVLASSGRDLLEALPWRHVRKQTGRRLRRLRFDCAHLHDRGSFFLVSVHKAPTCVGKHQSES